MAKKDAKSRKQIMEERAKKLKDRSSGPIKFFFIKEGVTRMRMPQIVDDQEFCTEVTYFYFGKEIGGFVSPQTFGEPCPAWELYQKLKTGDDDDKEVAGKITPKRRYMGPHYRFKDEKGKEVDTDLGVKLCLLTGAIYQDITDMYLDDEKGDFTDPKEGYDFKYKRTGTGQFDTEYSVLDCKPSRCHAKYRKKVYDPEEMIRDIMPSYEDIEVMLNDYLGMGTGDDGAPKKKKKKKKTTKKKTSTKRKGDF